MSESWGPQCIVPSALRRTYSGKVTLSESFDQSASSGTGGP